jgi:riboflavin kinase/FMN adenylyltransferase
MRLIRNLDELRHLPTASVVTIGNFDGVHIAHQKLLRQVVESARVQDKASIAVTFEPHPIKLLAPERAPKVLTPLERKARLIERFGIDLLVVLAFTKELAHLSPVQFVRGILTGRLQATTVLVGPNFRFGYRQSGDIEVLRAIARQEGFQVQVVPEVDLRGERVSSTRIRELLSAGQVPIASRLLGRPFSNYGPIVSGLGVGHRHTVPTLNLAPVEEQLPKIGVYVTRTLVGNTAHDSVTNVGHRPTFGDNHRLTVETFLLKFEGAVEQRDMEIEYLYRLRDEMKFQNPAILKAQIQDDARRSLKFFRLLRRFHQEREKQSK